MANAFTLVHEQFLGSVQAFEPAPETVWVVANNLYSLYARGDSKAVFRSKSLAPEFQGENRAMTVSKLSSSDGEYFTLGFHTLLPRDQAGDPNFDNIGFGSINTEEGFRQTGILSGGKIQEDSTLGQMGYTRHQMRVTNDVLEVIVF